MRWLRLGRVNSNDSEDCGRSVDIPMDVSIRIRDLSSGLPYLVTIKVCAAVPDMYVMERFDGAYMVVHSVFVYGRTIIGVRMDQLEEVQLDAG